MWGLLGGVPCVQSPKAHTVVSGLSPFSRVELNHLQPSVPFVAAGIVGVGSARNEAKLGANKRRTTRKIVTKFLNKREGKTGTYNDEEEEMKQNRT